MERAFLASIAAAPDDDGPRLVFADWLEERGECERAEFIRVQVKMHKAPLKAHNREMTYREFEKLQVREQELFDRLGANPFSPNIFCTVTINSEHLTLEDPLPCLLVQRGFGDTIRCSCSAWLTHAAAIIEAVPMLREVRLSDKSPLHTSVGILSLREGESHCSSADRYVFKLVDGQHGYCHFLLPRELWQSFADVAQETIRPDTSLYFETEAEALTFASVLCLSFAQRENSAAPGLQQ